MTNLTFLEELPCFFYLKITGKGQWQPSEWCILPVRCPIGNIYTDVWEKKKTVNHLLYSLPEIMSISNKCLLANASGLGLANKSSWPINFPNLWILCGHHRLHQQNGFISVITDFSTVIHIYEDNLSFLTNIIFKILGNVNGWMEYVNVENVEILVKE